MLAYDRRMVIPRPYSYKKVVELVVKVLATSQRTQIHKETGQGFEHWIASFKLRNLKRKIFIKKKAIQIYLQLLRWGQSYVVERKFRPILTVNIAYQLPSIQLFVLPQSKNKVLYCYGVNQQPLEALPRVWRHNLAQRRPIHSNDSAGCTAAKVGGGKVKNRGLKCKLNNE